MSDGSKRCTKCGEAKTEDAFSRNACQPGGRNTHCKECRRAAHKRWYAANADRAKAAAMARYAEKRDEILAQRAAEYARDPESKRQASRAYYAAHREEQAEMIRAWRKANPGLVLALDARKRGASAIEIFSLKELFDHLRSFGIDPDLCMYCHDAPRQEWDHILALCLGGAHTLANLAPSCVSCNARKGVAERAELRRRRAEASA